MTTAIKSRGIFMSAESVDGIWADLKTQTRRICRDQTKHRWLENHEVWPPQWKGKKGQPYTGWVVEYPNPHLLLPRKCPYGVTGDLLWVRRTRAGKFIWRKAEADLWLLITDVRVERVQEITAWDALQEGVDLPIPAGVNVRGMHPEYTTWTKARQDDWVNGEARAIYFSQCADAQDHIDEFGKHWDSLNAKRGHPWSDNEWVWVIGFKRTTQETT